MEPNKSDSGNIEEQERVVIKKDRSNLIIKIAGSAIFSALSYVVQWAFKPIVDAFRIPGWEMTWFDPVSIIWIMAFFIFGYEAGFLTTIIGSLLLLLTDPAAWLGPLMKFTATIPLIIVPLVVMKLRRKTLTSENLLEKKNIILSWFGSVSIRVPVMMLMNYIAIIYLLPLILPFPISPADFNLDYLGLPAVNGWFAVFITVIIANTIQTVWDIGGAYLIVKAVLKIRNIPW
ncbi:MAG: hypothetical protein GF364_12795 [Candidatus Lokiarchaeota archaeon]|nr:hypothetical protein [Candidatus Lokiarchaeota archaeon]